MLVVLFILLALLNLIELSTPYSRLCGIKIGSLSSGLQLQSTLSILSRFINALFMPLLGILSDTSYLEKITWKEFQISLLLYILIGFCVLLLNQSIIKWYGIIIRSIKYTGSLFKLSTSKDKDFKWKKFKGTKKFNKIKIMTVLGFIPQYISWPLVICLLGQFPENRGFILSITSVLNGINSLLLVLFIDPYIVKLETHKNIAEKVLREQVEARLYALTISAILMSVYIYFILMV